MTRGRLLLWTSIAAYCLIGVEIVVMISPFALYFYSVYGPLLDRLAASPYTGWTTEFFLPHMVFPDDPLILAVSYLQLLLVAGLLLFFSAALPLYYGRFTGKGVVQVSFYRKIRHPQYLFLAVSGFGLLLYWPRFIILILYVTMLFVYYLLARNEEWRMRQEAPAAYERYMAATPMFLPGEPGGRFYRALFGWLRPKWAGIALLYLLSLAAAVGLAMGVRAYAVRTLPLVTVGDMTVVPVFPREAGTVGELYRRALADPAVARQLARRPDINQAYLMPGDFFLMALVTDANRRFSDEMIERFPEIIEWHRHKFRGGLGKFFRIFYNFVSTLGTVHTDYEVERLVFVAVHDRAGQRVAPERLFAMGLSRTPALIVDLDARSRRVLQVIPTSESHKWGRMPMPTF
ncbi:MAG: hypothetical protein ACOY8P_09505 [Thermodesulfobacteriota bacterium]